MTEKNPVTPPSEPGPMGSGVSGASAERTRFAWRRTILAATAVGLLMVRVGVRAHGSALTGMAIAGAALGWAATLWLGQRRINAMADPRPRDIGRVLPAMALVTAGIAVVGVLLVLGAKK